MRKIPNQCKLEMYKEKEIQEKKSCTTNIFPMKVGYQCFIANLASVNLWLNTDCHHAKDKRNILRDFQVGQWLHVQGSEIWTLWRKSEKVYCEVLLGYPGLLVMILCTWDLRFENTIGINVTLCIFFIILYKYIFWNCCSYLLL